MSIYEDDGEESQELAWPQQIYLGIFWMDNRLHFGLTEYIGFAQ